MAHGVRTVVPSAVIVWEMLHAITSVVRVGQYVTSDGKEATVSVVSIFRE